jgi:hypothetical protein
MITKRVLQIQVMFVCMLFLAVGCQTTPTQPDTQASPTKIAYATIKSSAIAYDSIMNALADLDKQGKISDAQQAAVIDYGNKFWVAYHTSVDALIAFKKGGSEADLENSLSTLTSALSSFLGYSAEITK